MERDIQKYLKKPYIIKTSKNKPNIKTKTLGSYLYIYSISYLHLETFIYALL
jgi:hypothetical protein